MPDPAEALESRLPSELFALLRPLLGHRLLSVGELRRQVVAYRAALRNASKSQAWPDMDFELGDLDRPFVTGHLYENDLPVPYELPGGASMSARRSASRSAGGAACQRSPGKRRTRQRSAWR